jgi:hypothetical protein
MILYIETDKEGNIKMDLMGVWITLLLGAEYGH